MNLIMIMEMTSVILQQMKNIFLKMNMMQMRMMIGCDFQLLQDNFGYYNHFLYRISVLPSSSRSINLTCQPSLLQPIMMTNVHISDSTGPTDVISHPQSGKKRKGRGKTTGLSIQKKRKYSDNGKLEVIIPPDRTIAVGPGANDFVTELSVKVFQHARHDVKNWKNVSNLAKDRIIAHIFGNSLYFS
ncbi:uncharacterized protein LOC132045921 isoform X1 [Lycium ferocissimum]|uniref:uncharacterized protein LOC132045921 isoform X1 n=1 Tax=Lycium ferocissimum TaxID=112874 RepID=UPI002814C3F8|nr:uncharacterized protein LOC132045921 isoform X1 [Lycium ferocissimum]